MGLGQIVHDSWKTDAAHHVVGPTRCMRDRAHGDFFRILWIYTIGKRPRSLHTQLRNSLRISVFDWTTTESIL